MRKNPHNRVEEYRRKAFARDIAKRLATRRDRTTVGKMLGMSRQQVEYVEMRALHKLIHRLREVCT